MNDTPQIVFGLEKYFNFINDTVKERFIRLLIGLQFHPEGDRPWSLKEIISFDYDTLSSLHRTDRINTYTAICISHSLDLATTVNLLNTAWPEDDFCKKLHSIMEAGQGDMLLTIFSKTQVLSKIWLGEVLTKFHKHFNNVLLVGGWTTHHTLFLKNIKIDNLFSIDIDNTINDFARVFNPNVIIDNSDVNTAFTHDNILINGAAQCFDLIINTSAEHMTTEWFDKLPLGTTVLIQSNNMEDEGHINKSTHLAEFVKKYPLSITNYRGDVNFNSYRRFMVFGVK